MSVRFNNDLALWSLGVLQPASSAEVLRFISGMYPDAALSISKGVIDQALAELQSQGHILCVHEEAKLYSLTFTANRRLPKLLRAKRDAARLFLMKRRRDAKFASSGESVETELGGDSPSPEDRSLIKGSTRAIFSTAAPLEIRHPGRKYRPRVIQQLELPAGSEIDSPDVHFRYGSFATLAQIRMASSEKDGPDLSLNELALAIGITPALLRKIIMRKERHYRTFTIPKQSGGERRIDAPRVFLKSIQQWISDVFAARIPIHSASHAYQFGKSILTNAQPHLCAKYVAGIDIRDFFGSVTKGRIFDLFRRSGYGPNLSETLATLCTFRGVLPQGAPTSPALSNAYLFHFDDHLNGLATQNGLKYTRYADDMTISGPDKSQIIEFIAVARSMLTHYDLELSEKKTRIVSQRSQQRVTGIVVNQFGYPPRRLRRNLRAACHKASRAGKISEEEFHRIRGTINYLHQFEGLRESPELIGYLQLLKKLKIDASPLEGRP